MKNKIKTLILVAVMTAGISLAIPTETHAQYYYGMAMVMVVTDMVTGRLGIVVTGRTVIVVTDRMVMGIPITEPYGSR